MRSLLVSLAFLAVSTATSADEVMRCGNWLVAIPVSLEELHRKCGEPAEKSRTYILRRPQFESGGNTYAFPGEEQVPVDLWTYDFGPSKLKQRVRMIAGQVDSIETLKEHGTD